MFLSSFGAKEKKVMARVDILGGISRMFWLHGIDIKKKLEAMMRSSLWTQPFFHPIDSSKLRKLVLR